MPRHVRVRQGCNCSIYGTLLRTTGDSEVSHMDIIINLWLVAMGTGRLVS